MHRALMLAAKGLGQVAPNPMVGAVIVHEGKIIGEGWHQAYGGPHAEVHAIAAVQDKRLLPQSTMYVSLEPCAHFGKTPPCADLIVEVGMQRVVIAQEDPFSLVAGKGIARLQAKGIEVTTGVLEAEASMLNRRFLTAQKNKRPYILLKWAQTEDGFIARDDGSSKWISGALARKLVHKWRAEEQGIMVGTGTALMDNPSLTVRDWPGRHPIRITFDRQGTLHKGLQLFDGSAPTLVFSTKPKDYPNAETLLFPPSAALKVALGMLFERGIHSVLVEGGAKLLHAFIAEGLWDEARVFTSPVRFGSGFRAPVMDDFELMREEKVEQDRLCYFFNKNY